MGDTALLNDIIKKIDNLYSSISDANEVIPSENELLKLNELFDNLYNRKIQNEEDFLLTKPLKTYSCMVLTYIVISFKLAYIKEIKRIYNLKLPIILDSPCTDELTIDATQKMIDLINQEFKVHQLIILSVYKLKNLSNNVIELNLDTI